MNIFFTILMVIGFIYGIVSLTLFLIIFIPELVHRGFRGQHIVSFGESLAMSMIWPALLYLIITDR